MAKKENTEGKNLKEHLKDIAKILEWFEAQEELDVEEALKKVEEAKDLIKASKTKLVEVENKFEEIKREIED